MTNTITLPRAVGEEMRDALTCGKSGRHWCPHCDDYVDNFRDVLDAALAEPPATREPVAHVENGVLVRSALPKGYTGPLYAAPPEPATDEQAAAAYDGKRGTRQWVDFRDGWQAAERFHGITKEGGK